MKPFPELTLVQSVAHTLSSRARIHTLAKIPVPERARAKVKEFPLYGFSIGSEEPTAPVLGIVGGVHGLERIGSQVVLSSLISWVERLHWDETLMRDLEHFRLVVVPILNPVGMFMESRSNGNGVDLMRNAPVDAEDKTHFLMGGHRITNRLPWYRGLAGAPMELENQVLCEFIKKESFQSEFSLWLDVHSGYGIHDRLWFPYAKSTRPFPHLPESFALKTLFDRTYPYHVYQIEPQSHEYTTHGDVWDYIYEQRHHGLVDHGVGPLLMPLTLEMGSWAWIKKNPLQLFSFLGPFNPIKPHRKKRILRRHLNFFDFLMRAVMNHSVWSRPSTEERGELLRAAMAHWYA
ncbi:MAG: DUF2817 domain-containing protein [Bdellovibrionales bacterium]|nr:DUF2817 domain-containing protein [Bdellovibrionales bacterium]